MLHNRDFGFATAFAAALENGLNLSCDEEGFCFPVVEILRRRAGDRLFWGRAMTSMKEREESFEKKFAHDEELKFKAIARRNRLLGLWAAEKLGRTGEEAEAYAREVVMSDFQEVGDEDVFRKIRQDFDAAGVQQSDHQIRRTMEELLATAIEQVKTS
jgi:hypothetical protein